MRYSLLLLAACAGSMAAPPTGGEPEWTRYAGGSRIIDGKRTFYGVGNAAFLKSPQLAENRAENRARAQLAKVVETFASYSIETAPNKAELQQQVAMVVQGLSAKTLQRTTIVEHYTDADGASFALAQLDYAAVEAALQRPDAKKLYDDFEYKKVIHQPGFCDASLRLRGLDRANCPVPGNTTVAELHFLCTGGETAMRFGDLELTGKVGAAGSVDLQGSGARIVGQLKGEASFDYGSHGCSMHATVVSQ